MTHALAPTADPLALLVDDCRLEVLRRHPAGGRRPSGHRHGPTGEPDLHLETGLSGGSAAVRGRHGLAFPLSLSLHALVLGALLVVPLLVGEANPAPSRAVRAFFVEPAVVPVPPPPPPAPARSVAGSRMPRRLAPTPAQAFVAPIAVPEAVMPEIDLGLGAAGGMEGGVEGGIEGGVPGGIVGGVLGGLPAAPPPPQAPVRVGGIIKAPRRIVDATAEYPLLARQARIQGVVILEAVIDVDGVVKDVKVLRGVPTLDEAAAAAVRQWRYEPTLVSGVPTPVVMVVTVTFQLRTPPGR